MMVRGEKSRVDYKAVHDRMFLALNLSIAFQGTRGVAARLRNLTTELYYSNIVTCSGVGERCIRLF